MKKILLLLSACLFITVIAKSQPINFSWAKSMGGKGPDGEIGIAKDAAGDIYITGEFLGTRTFGTFTLTSYGFSDIFVAKYSSTGTCLWAINGGGSFSEAYGGKIAVSGNEVYVTGSFTNVLDFNGLNVSSTGIKDIFVAGLDASNGTCTWLKSAGSVFNDVPYGIEISATGGFLLCGTFTGTATFGTQTVVSSSISDFDIFYAKYTSAGICTWVKRIGNTGVDKAYDIKELPSGNILLTGTFEGSVLFGTGINLTSYGFPDFFLASFDASGITNWAVKGGGQNNDAGYGISVDPLGNIYATGFIGDTATFGPVTINNAGGINVMVAKFSPTGVCSWVKMGGNVVDDIGYDIATDFGGSSYVTGYINGSCYFGTTQVSGVAAIDVFVAKYDNAGLLRWITKIGASSDDRGRAILVEPNGFCIVAGDYGDNVAFGTTGLTADPGSFGVFLTRMGGGTLDINEPGSRQFSMFPNPANDFVQLNLQNIKDDGFTLSLYGIDGKLVHSEMLSQKNAVSDYKLDLQKFAAGTYSLKLETSKGDFSQILIVGK